MDENEISFDGTSEELSDWIIAPTNEKLEKEKSENEFLKNKIELLEEQLKLRDKCEELEILLRKKEVEKNKRLKKMKECDGFEKTQARTKHIIVKSPPVRKMSPRQEITTLHQQLMHAIESRRSSMEPN